MRRVSDTMSPLRKRPHSRVVLERHLWSYSRGTTCRRTIRQRTPLASGRAHSKPTSVGWSRHQSGHRSRADSVVCALGLDGVAEGDCAGYKRDEPGAEPRLAVPAPVTRQSPDRLLAAGKCDRVNRGHDAAVAHHSRAELQVSDPQGRHASSANGSSPSMTTLGRNRTTSKASLAPGPDRHHAAHCG